MGSWSRAEQSRERLVLFAARLDEVLGVVHPVRLLDEILGRVDWGLWEAQHHGGRGQPPIPPRVPGCRGCSSGFAPAGRWKTPWACGGISGCCRWLNFPSPDYS